ncbi:MAG: DUF6884 domain-containing protein [Chloroflexota bacterium]
MFAEAVEREQVAGRADAQLPRLLILRCASTKRPGAAPMPALERYDGPAFRVLRKYLRSEPSDPPLIRIVSAEHGLMSEEQLIEEYDRRMTVERAQELRPAVLATLEALVQRRPVREVMVVVGQTYLQALDGIEQVLDGTPVRIAGETQGRKLGALRAWLYGEAAGRADAGSRRQPQNTTRQLALVPSAEMAFRVGGRRFTTSADEAIRVARHAVSLGEKDATRITRWYVPVDGERVSPKWLVARMSGASPRDFQANTARGILERLGIPVVQIEPANHTAS